MNSKTHFHWPTLSLLLAVIFHLRVTDRLTNPQYNDSNVVHIISKWKCNSCFLSLFAGQVHKSTVFNCRLTTSTPALSPQRPGSAHSEPVCLLHYNPLCKQWELLIHKRYIKKIILITFPIYIYIYIYIIYIKITRIKMSKACGRWVKHVEVNILLFYYYNWT